MILSVIIVNYNVRYFLEQCLFSVEKALWEITDQAEIIVVDNASQDKSVEYLSVLFPRVKFIANKDNRGFSRANNQALLQATGKYVLFLNPDTIIPEDFFSKCLQFFQDFKDAGAIGVQMVDGGGRYLQESKRGFPTPWVAFAKLSGLTAAFPHSRRMAGYYLGHLHKDETHRAPVLSGACMMVRKEALDKTGGFDERFFMYAEDIDLSYRVEQAGYNNYYFAGTTIVHFKGESTNKDARYTRIFYKAMSQFRHKHFTKGLSSLFNYVLDGAIWARAGLSALFRPLRRKAAVMHGKDFGGRKTLLKGDPGTMETLQGRIVDLVQSETAAEQIIYCEGPAFSFKDFIYSIREQQGVAVRRIHAAGSHSIVGSAEKTEMGEVGVV